MIDEALLQFIWQHKLYKPANLTATSGESITVLHAGHINRNAGPDFTAARISIGNTTLVGNIELHLKTSDWQKHKHDNDPNYKNIILHVVYENDITAHNSDNVLLLELKSAIAEEVLIRYQAMSKEKTGIPCKHQHEQVPSLVKESWLNRMLAERWDEKLADWQVQLKNTNNDWRNLLYHRLAHNMGFNTNATPFLLLAQSTPLNILAKHRDSIEQLEALLFGQAGLLNNDKDNKYAEELKTEYTYLKTKYQLSPIAGHLWKFLRMRPANFPTVRIAQFASLIHTSEHLFSKITEAQTLEQLEPLFEMAASSFWDSHYTFDKEHPKPAPKKLGQTSFYNIVINTLAPIKYLHARANGMDKEASDALTLLSAVPPETNHIIDKWKQNQWVAENASQTQSMIQMHNRYCTAFKCLQCSIGLSILRKGAR